MSSADLSSICLAVVIMNMLKLLYPGCDSEKNPCVIELRLVGDCPKHFPIGIMGCIMCMSLFQVSLSTYVMQNVI
jgi:hypothetical protein